MKRGQYLNTYHAVVTSCGQWVLEHTCEFSWNYPHSVVGLFFEFVFSREEQSERKKGWGQAERERKRNCSVFPGCC